MKTEVNALILAGGRSRRMGTDKASLMLEGQTLLQRTAGVVAPHASQVYLSVAKGGQRETSLPVIEDLETNPGPLGGLQAAFAQQPEKPWLLVACDLPLLDDMTLDTLLRENDERKPATAFRNRLDGRAEPLCAIYKPSAANALNDYLSRNKRCARGFLESLEPTLLDLPSPLALDNANRPEHLNELTSLARDGMREKTVTISYYGKLSSEVPATPEAVTTTAATLAGLYEEQRLTLGLSLDLDVVKPVINDAFTDWTTPLPDQAEVAFLPPFAGG
ncbi:MAG: NTP transferase domain-containing protein [Verrucomicrobiota bacterium JB023]|nr:NTP transferase domain-containing protein [Verrucomicrobiota bacterium JB023]